MKTTKRLNHSADETVEHVAQLRWPLARVSTRVSSGHVTDAIGRYGIPTILALLLAFFCLERPASFATTQNLLSILDTQSVGIVLALAVLLPLVVGEFDLSVAGVQNLVNVVAVILAGRGWNLALVIVVCIGTGALIGTVNAIALLYLRVNAFVATLATGTIAGGLAVLFTGGAVVYGPTTGAFLTFGRGAVGGASLSDLYMVLIGTVLALMLGMTPLGRRMHAVGGNRRASKLTGISTYRYVGGAFVGSGVLAAFSGVMLASQLGTASPSVSSSVLLTAFAGAFLGAASIRPGRFNVLGTVIGVLTVEVAVSGLEQMGAPTWVEPVLDGVVLIVAVAVTGWATRRKAQAARRRQLQVLTDEIQLTSAAELSAGVLSRSED